MPGAAPSASSWLSPAPWVAPARPTPSLATRVGHTRDPNGPRVASASGVRVTRETERGATRATRTEGCAGHHAGGRAWRAALTTTRAVVHRGARAGRRCSPRAQELPEAGAADVRRGGDAAALPSRAAARCCRPGPKAERVWEGNIKGPSFLPSFGFSNEFNAHNVAKGGRTEYISPRPHFPVKPAPGGDTSSLPAGWCMSSWTAREDAYIQWIVCINPVQIVYFFSES